MEEIKQDQAIFAELLVLLGNNPQEKSEVITRFCSTSLEELRNALPPTTQLETIDF